MGLPPCQSYYYKGFDAQIASGFIITGFLGHGFSKVPLEIE
jgi:hypothetical protein